MRLQQRPCAPRGPLWPAQEGPGAEVAQRLLGIEVIDRFMNGTARRLRLATAALVVGFAAASYAALAGLKEVHDALHAVKEQETQMRAALSLASAARDEYAHVAHTIILGNASHVPLYQQAHARVLELLARLDELSAPPEHRQLVEFMRRSSIELEREFTTRVVPAVERGDRPEQEKRHMRVLEIVGEIERGVDQLALLHESTAGDFELHAAAVQHATFRWTVILLVGSTALAAGLSLYIGRAVSRPLQKLEAGAIRLAQGDLSTRIDLPSRDEFGRLAAQIDRMAAALGEQQEQLIQSEKLAGIGRLAAGVAHEINNPLGVILGYARVLQRRVDERAGEDLRVIEEEALRCRDIVEGLLDLARPERTGSDNVELRATCNEIVERLREARQLSEQQVRVEGEGRVVGNAARLRQALTNLVKNAMDAVGTSGGILVRIESGTDSDGVVRVRVRDTGPGLSEEDQQRLFEPFYTTKPGGTGLGLAVSRAIARAHGGDIQARNCERGGAEFVLRLPRRA
jgi:two-component system, NtrC family, sensor kinase